MSLFGNGDVPETTGSITLPVAVAQPLPPTLAYSDAAKIGEAANVALLMQAENVPPQDWINATTGSSGTLEAAADTKSDDNCRPFSTTVTSLGGVHQYSGAVCRKVNGGTVVQIDERSPEDRS